MLAEDHDDLTAIREQSTARCAHVRSKTTPKARPSTESEHMVPPNPDSIAAGALPTAQTLLANLSSVFVSRWP